MGNRASIRLQAESGEEHPVTLYLHWNGGMESVVAFLQFTWKTYDRTHNDVYLFHARLCQVLGNFFHDGLSLYAFPNDVAVNTEDNGHYDVRITETGPAIMLKGKDGNYFYRNIFDEPEKPDAITRAKRHKYWTNPDGTIFDWIRVCMPKPTKED